MSRVVRLLVPTLLLLTLAACGNKGPLVLPTKPQPSSAPQAPAPASKTDAAKPADSGAH
ncbi:MAG TPA: lipoprotein [Rudaea sp.]